MPSELNCRIIRARILRKSTNHSPTQTVNNQHVAQPTLDNRNTQGTQQTTVGNGTDTARALISNGGNGNNQQSNTCCAADDLQMFCELKFGNEDEPQISEFFEREEHDAQDNAENLSSSVWQGRLIKSFFRFEMELDDDLIKLKSLEIKVCEQSDFQDEIIMGLVQIDISPLLFKNNSQRYAGWFPIYSVDKGITGEIYSEIQLDYTADRSNENQQQFNITSSQQQMKQINFFSSKAPPYYEVHQIIGFVEELVDFKLEKTDLEDQIALQESVLRLRRRLGEIVKKKNGNAIITYRQSVEHTGEHSNRVVLRGYGTAALVEVDQQAQQQMLESSQLVSQQSAQIRDLLQQQPYLSSQNQQTTQQQINTFVQNSMGNVGDLTPLQQVVAQTPASVVMDHISTAAGIQNPQNHNLSLEQGAMFRKQAMNQIEGLQKQKIQLITTDTMPSGENELNYAIRFGCAVSARAVRKLSGEKQYEQAQQQAPKRLTSKIASEWNQWWGELRQEIYKSAKQLNCTHVLGYREMVSIYQSMCIFTAFGTAVRASPATQKKYTMDQVARYYKVASTASQAIVKKDSSNNLYGTNKGNNTSSRTGRVSPRQPVATSASQSNNNNNRINDFATTADQDIRAKQRGTRQVTKESSNEMIQDKSPKGSLNPYNQTSSQGNNFKDGQLSQLRFGSSDKLSDHSSNSQQAADAKLISDELKTADTKSCKFCHVVPPRKKVKYPQGKAAESNQHSSSKNEFTPGPNLHKCLSCGERYVPEVIIATINPPDGLQIIGRPQLIEARAIKMKQYKGRSSRAKEQDMMAFSDQVFLIEYSLHNQLLTKLKLAGKNALFCYRTSIQVNSTSITGLATGTAVCLQALPLSKPIKIVPSPYLADNYSNSQVQQQVAMMGANGNTSNADEPLQQSCQQQIFSQIENLSKFNIRRLMEQSIVSIQSPYTYMRDLPIRRVIENLVATQMSMAEHNSQYAIQQQNEREKNQMQHLHEPVKIDVKLNNRPNKDVDGLELSSIMETHEGKYPTPVNKAEESQIGPLRSKTQVKLQDLAAGKDDHSCEINTSNQLTEEAENEKAEEDVKFNNDINKISQKLLGKEGQQESLIVLLKDSIGDSPPKRLDFSGLRPDQTDQGHGDVEPILPKIRIRSGSLSEKKSMEYLISTARDPAINSNLQNDTPAVLVIRTKKHSIDERDDVGTRQLEAETYMQQRSLQGKTVWTKETLLKESHSKQPNRRGLQTVKHFQQESKAITQEQQPQQSNQPIEAMVHYYNSNGNFPSVANSQQQSQKRTQISKNMALNNQVVGGGIKPIAVPNKIPSPNPMSNQQQQQFTMDKDGVVTMNTTQLNPQENFDNCTLSMILQINDQNDVESLKSLIDPVMPPSIVFLSSYYDLVNYNFQKVQAIQDVHFYARMFRLKMLTAEQLDGMSNITTAAAQGTNTNHTSRSKRKRVGSNSKEAMIHQNEFNRVMQSAYKKLANDLIEKKLTPCVVCALRTHEKIHDDNTVDVFFTCSILKTRVDQPHYFLKQNKKDYEALLKANLGLPTNLTDWYRSEEQVQNVNSSTNQAQNNNNNSNSSNPVARKDGNHNLADPQAPSTTFAQSISSAITKKKSKKKEKNSSGGGFFSFLFCSNKSSKPKQQYAEYSPSFRYRNVRNVSADESILLLPMSVFPGMSTRANYGLVGVHLIRRVYLPEQELQREDIPQKVAQQGQQRIELVIEDLVADLNEIVRTRVRSLGGNCLIGYKVSIDGFDQIVDENKVYLMVSAIGDAVLLEEQKQVNAPQSSMVSDVNKSNSQSERNPNILFNDMEEQKDGNLRLPLKPRQPTTQ